MRGRKRRNDIDSSEFDNVVSLYKNKISLKQIAFDYDVTAYVVRDVLVGMGVEIGPRGRPRVSPYVDVGPAMAAVEVMHEQFQDDNALDLGDFRRPLGE